MLLALRASSSRLVSRSFTTSARSLEKATLRPSAEAATPLDLLTKIGRGAEKRLATQGESWEALNGVWKKGAVGMKDSGLNVKDRRYVLWALSRYSQGSELSTFLKAQKPAKKFRGSCVL